MTKLKIKITKAILKESMMCQVSGEKMDVLRNCAIAEAVREIFPNATVGHYLIIYIPHQLIIKLPNSAINFITEFDHLRNTPEKRLEMPEISFEIEIPDSVLDSIGISEIRQIVEKSETLELV